MEKVGKNLVNSWIKQGHTYEWISTELKKIFPENNRGFSAQSVCRFCSNEGIAKMTENELNDVVRRSVNEVNCSI